MDLPSPSLWSAFQDGHRLKKGERVIEMTCRDVGALTLPTGHIVACDPQFDLTQPAFETVVTAGEYPAYLALAFGGVALVMIQFRDGTPARWHSSEPARFGVDSGMGCIMDAKLVRMLLRKSQDGQWDRYWKRIDDGLNENDGLWANVCLHQESSANALVFRTYGGDGIYATYWGYSESGNLLCSVTDMFLEDGVEEI